MKILLPKLLGKNRTEPDIARNGAYMTLLRAMQKIKLGKSSETRALAKDLLQAAYYMTLVNERVNDLGGFIEPVEDDMLVLFEDFICAANGMMPQGQVEAAIKELVEDLNLSVK